MNFLSDLFEVRHPDELLEIEPLYLPELTSALQMLIRKSLPALDPGENFYEKLRESLPHIA